MAFPCPALELAEQAEVATRQLVEAARARASEWSQHTVLRWVAGASDGFPGEVIDRYADWACLNVEGSPSREVVEERARSLCRLGARGVYLKRRVRADLRHADVSELAPNTPLRGEAAPDELVVDEGPLRFSVALADGLSTGLFIDQRDNRRLVMDQVRGGRLLNLFSYTCSFTVAAAAGGTRESVNVDVSGRALGRGRRNLELNARQIAERGESVGNHRMFKEDVRAYLPRALRRDQRFDWVVLDPPSFGTGKSKSFRFGRDYPPVARDAFRLLDDGGRMLCVANHRGTDLPGFRQMIREAATSAGVKLRELQTLTPPPDCAPDAETSWTKSLLATIA